MEKNISPLNSACLQGTNASDLDVLDVGLAESDSLATRILRRVDLITAAVERPRRLAREAAAPDEGNLHNVGVVLARCDEIGRPRSGRLCVSPPRRSRPSCSARRAGRGRGSTTWRQARHRSATQYRHRTRPAAHPRIPPSGSPRSSQAAGYQRLQPLATHCGKR